MVPSAGYSNTGIKEACESDVKVGVDMIVDPGRTSGVRVGESFEDSLQAVVKTTKIVSISLIDFIGFGHS